MRPPLQIFTHSSFLSTRSTRPRHWRSILFTCLSGTLSQKERLVFLFRYIYKRTQRTNKDIPPGKSWRKFRGQKRVFDGYGQVWFLWIRIDKIDLKYVKGKIICMAKFNVFLKSHIGSPSEWLLFDDWSSLVHPQGSLPLIINIQQYDTILNDGHHWHH